MALVQAEAPTVRECAARVKLRQALVDHKSKKPFYSDWIMNKIEAGVRYLTASARLGYFWPI